MPPRRKKCNSVAAMKKKKLIDNRLLEISLLVEDYIFEDKPIGRHEAETYAKEVASYENKVLGDERSLQVIEKLRRHMKGIIAEQGQLVDEDIFTQPLPGTTPVYPVLDDDMTQYTQEIAVEDLTQEFNRLNCVEEPVQNGRNQRKATVKRNIRKSSGLDDFTQCTQYTDVEDLTQEFDSLNSVPAPIKRARNKRKAVKRTSVDDDMTQCTQDADIGVDYEGINGLGSVDKPNTRARNKRNVIIKHLIRKPKVKMNVSENYNSDLDVINLCDDYDDKVTGCNNSLNVEASPQGTISSIYIPNTPAVLTVCSPSILTSFDAVPGKSKSNKREVSEQLHPNAKDTVINIDKSTKTLINEDIEIQMEFPDINIPERATPFPTKDNDIEEIDNMKIIPLNNMNIRNTSKIFNTQKISANPPAISKNKVERPLNTHSKANKFKKDYNDLSWLKNIRYVREIAKEEYVNVLVPENFWNNCTLPEKWNDDDFLYT